MAPCRRGRRGPRAATVRGVVDASNPLQRKKMSGAKKGVLALEILAFSNRMHRFVCGHTSALVQIRHPDTAWHSFYCIGCNAATASCIKAAAKKLLASHCSCSTSNHGSRRRHGQVLGPALQRRHRTRRRWLLKKEVRREAARLRPRRRRRWRTRWRRRRRRWR